MAIMLSRNFSVAEFEKSKTAVKHGISNKMNAEQIENAKLICEFVLQPLRDYIGKPIEITSGFRGVELNKLIKGSKTSDHCKGKAVDIKFKVGKSYQNKILFDKIIELKLPFDQLIYEFGTDENPDWVHVSYRKEGNRNQILRAKKVKRKTVYLEIKY